MLPIATVHTDDVNNIIANIPTNDIIGGVVMVRNFCLLHDVVVFIFGLVVLETNDDNKRNDDDDECDLIIIMPAIS